MGAPAVAADIPACREVGADAALYYESGNASSLGEALCDLFESPQRATDLGRRGLDRGRVFQWRDNALGVYQSLRKAVA